MFCGSTVTSAGTPNSDKEQSLTDDTEIATLLPDRRFVTVRDRKARVRVDGVLSTTRNMTSGVPQGTILAPMLFVLFVDDLAQQMEQAGFHFLAYADDVAFLAAAEEVSQLEEQVARGLDIIEKWAEDLRLMLSREKTVVLARKPDGSKLSLDVKFGADSSGVREELACVPALRYLGLRFEAESDGASVKMSRSFCRQTERSIKAVEAGSHSKPNQNCFCRQTVVILVTMCFLFEVFFLLTLWVSCLIQGFPTETTTKHQKRLNVVSKFRPEAPAHV